MSTNRKKRRRSKKPAALASRLKTGNRQKKSSDSKAVGWRRRHPVFLFLVVFAALMGVYYALALFTPFYERQFPYYLGFNARLSGTVLAFLGQDITVSGESIFSPAFSISVKQGCDAIEPTALFVCAVLAFPAAFLKKIPGIVAGAIFLAILNLIRIVTLFLVGVYFPRVFELMHLDVCQGLFIFFAVIFWILWMLWTMQSRTQTEGVSS